MILRSLFLAVLVVAAGVSNAQIQYGGQPASFKSSVKPSVAHMVFDAPDVAALKAADEDRSKPGPWRFGLERPVSIDVLDAARTTRLRDGSTLYSLAVRSTGALSMNLQFSDFHLPDGVEFFIHSPVTGQAIGRFDARSNNPHRAFATVPMAGDELVLEVLVPSGVEADRVGLTLSMVVHGYRDLFKMAKDFGDSGPCNNNVNCPEGDAWRDQQRSVAIMVSGGGGGFCTGALVNNTANDGTPYFLTADHCLGSATNFPTTVFVFNWETATCANPSSAPPMTESVTGAVIVARSPNSDFALMELDQTPPASYQVYYAGWDRTDANPSNQVAIHHPSGDVKKISFDDDAAAKTVWSGAQCWHIFNWEDGTTEPGSSGSPLFDQDQRIIGQLYGGTANCSNNIDDYYGRFGVSWDAGSTVSTRLREWLDPLGTNPTVLDGFDPNAPTAQFDAGIRSIGGIESSYCTGGATIIPTVTVRNNGLDTLTDILLTAGVAPDLTVVEFDGQLLPGQSTTLGVGDTLAWSAEGTFEYEAVIQTVNGVTGDSIPGNDQLDVDFTVTAGAPLEIVVKTDGYPEESTWRLLNSTGATIQFQDFDFGDDDQTFTYSYCLPEDCYTFVMEDDFGDGLCCGPEGFFELYLNQDLLVRVDGDFGDASSHDFCAEPTSIRDLDALEVRLVPNPVSGSSVRIDAPADLGALDVRLIDLMGRVLMNGSLGTDRSLALNGVSSGIYLVHITTDDGRTGTRRLVVR